MILLALLLYQLFFPLISTKGAKSDKEINHIIKNNMILKNRIAGFLLFGTVAFVIDWSRSFQSINSFYMSEIHFLWLLGIGIMLLIVVNILTANPKSIKYYPQLHFQNWNWKPHSLNAFTWIVYLFSYEWLWRGVLLHELRLVFNPEFSILINVSCYALLHLFKSKEEALASIPFGIVLCILALAMQSFLLPFLLHIMLALSFEYGCIKQLQSQNLKNISL